jgi:hypothetical protein
MFYTEPDISDVKLALQNGGAGVNYSGSATPAAIAQPLS